MTSRLETPTPPSRLETLRRIYRMIGTGRFTAREVGIGVHDVQRLKAEAFIRRDIAGDPEPGAWPGVYYITDAGLTALRCAGEPVPMLEGS